MSPVLAAAGPTTIPLPDGRTADLTTVDDRSAVAHVGIATVAGPDGDPAAPEVVRFHDLPSDSPARIDICGTAVDVRTLPRPSGELLARIATVNDVHFGEVAAGVIAGSDLGPARRIADGEEPYTEVMNRAAVAEIGVIEPDAVIVKGDLSSEGHDVEWDSFERCYGEPFGDRLHVIRGNHDAMRGQDRYAGDAVVDVDGLRLALLDTVRPGHENGDVSSDQAEWLGDVSSDSDRPVLVLGHHQQWIPDAGDEGRRDDGYFGIRPDGSDRLAEVCAASDDIIGYAAGHTHRHRVRSMPASGLPTIEVGCTKDFPGTWAEYRVYETGVVQVVHRISSPEALRWSESCRGLYADFGFDYSSYALGELGDRCFVIPLRS